MLTIKIEFSELLKAVEQLSEEQKVVLKKQLEVLTDTEKQPTEVKKKRTPGLHAGKIWISDDFDDPLPDEFWLGEDA